MIIYEPTGKAREYSPLAANLYSGCDNGCIVCYVPMMMKRFNPKYIHNKVIARKNIIRNLHKEAARKQNCKQVFMSFDTDPYNSEDEKLQLTRKALDIFFRNQIPVSICTKSGKYCLRDLDQFQRFGKHIQIGATLTFTNLEQSKKFERNAADPEERMEVLETLHHYGVKTWASLEPVMDPGQTLDLIKMTSNFVDHYKIGMLNHIKSATDWNYFLIRAVSLLRQLGKSFYIKNGLAEYAGNFRLHGSERNMDLFNVEWEK